MYQVQFTRYDEFGKLYLFTCSWIFDTLQEAVTAQIDLQSRGCVTKIIRLHH